MCSHVEFQGVSCVSKLVRYASGLGDEFCQVVYNSKQLRLPSTLVDSRRMGKPVIVVDVT